jgi:large subunit ribosomal protein L21
MQAVIITGGKQYPVSVGDVIQIEKIESEQGSTIDFDQVLMLVDGDAITCGQPFVAGAKVTAEVIEQGRGKKIRIIKFKRRKHYDKQQGHRQWLTKVKIVGVSAA